MLKGEEAKVHLDCYVSLQLLWFRFVCPSCTIFDCLAGVDRLQTKKIVETCSLCAAFGNKTDPFAFCLLLLLLPLLLSIVEVTESFHTHHLLISGLQHFKLDSLKSSTRLTTKPTHTICCLHDVSSAVAEEC